eukprot:scaffold3670_cov124-Cylindrotheca_fusiformis.AAC.37
MNNALFWIAAILPHPDQPHSPSMCWPLYIALYNPPILAAPVAAAVAAVTKKVFQIAATVNVMKVPPTS